MKLVTVASVCALASFAQAAEVKAVAKPVQNVVKSAKISQKSIVAEVKKSIVYSEAKSSEIAKIVESAIKAEPKQARAIANAAIAVAPDAHDEIMKVYLKFAPSAGSAVIGAKDAKDAKGDNEVLGGDPEPDSNPLDFPLSTTGGASGPTNGGPGGFPLLVPGGGGPFTSVPLPITTF